MEVRSVLDTNVIFSGLYSKQAASFQVLKAVLARKIQPVLSVTLLFEYEDVLKRKAEKLGFTSDEIDAFLDNLCDLAHHQSVHYLWRPFLSDPKDDHVLELAVASRVQHITTFNVKDFDGAEQFGVNIISPRRLLEEIRWEH